MTQCHRLALDFDEVVSDTMPRVLQAFENAGYPIPPHVHRYEDWNGRAPLSREESDTIVFSVTASLELASVIPPIEGAIQGIHEIQRLGVGVDILTARGSVEGELVAARHFLRQHGHGHLAVVGTALRPKGGFIDGHTMALDDSVRDLLSMPSAVYRLLFRQPRNEVFWQNPTDGIIPVRDWVHALEVIQQIAESE